MNATLASEKQRHVAGIETCRTAILASILCLLGALALSAWRLDAAQADGSVRHLDTLASTPLYFEANQGQADDGAEFIARGRRCNVLLSPSEAVLMLAGPKTSEDSAQSSGESDDEAQVRTVRLRFAGAGAGAKMTGIDALPGRVSYFLGSDPAKWRAGLPLFARVGVDALYPGVHLVYYCGQEQLEYDFRLDPGADPNQIKFQVQGADGVSVDAGGDLVLTIGGAEVREHKPVIYQIVDGRRVTVAGGYHVEGGSTVGFRVGNYYRRLPLVIDPILAFSTFLGGNKGDMAWSIALDPSGFIYIAGETFSANLRTNVASGAFQTTNAGNGRFNGDAFVAKFAGNSNLVYLTYLGGKRDDTALSVAADAVGNAYVTGFTDSTNFPIWPPNAFQPRIAGTNDNGQKLFPSDAFVAKLDPTGTQLLYSTYLGGNNRDAGNAIAVDSSGNAYVAGLTDSTNFPIVTNILATTVCQSRFGGFEDAFIAKINSNGTALVYSTFLGGTNQDNAQGIAIDSSGAAYVTGFTDSTNFPTAPFQNSFLNGDTNKFNRFFDGFFSKISPNGDSLVYSTYIGAENTDIALRDYVDGNSNLYVTGYTLSTNFPITTTVANTRPWANIRTNVFPDLFVMKFSPDPADPFYFTNYSVKFGGRLADIGVGIAADAAGNAYIVGYTSSTNFPTTTNLFGGLSTTNSSMRRNGRTNDVFITVLNSNATALVYSAYLGGSYNDVGTAIAVDPASGDAFIVGQTASTNFPLVNPFQAKFGGSTNDIFIAKIVMDPVLSAGPPAVAGDPLSLTWPGFGSEFALQSTTNLGSGVWTAVAQPPSSNGWHSILIDATNAAEFFRLHYQP